jgi:phosphohistidine swiveling domain-containing protein
MDSEPWVIPIAAAAAVDEQRIGGKTAQLARLHQTGFRIAPGFCVTVAAYEQFLRDNRLPRIIQMELGRKPFEDLRWEELWDAALRIRNRFSAAKLPLEVAAAIGRAVGDLGSGTPLAVRSSAPGEDSANRSFAGLHESLLHVVGEEAVLEAVRLVWASLWSDAALLYRQELALDPLHSRMAVLIQEMRMEDRSGVAFGRDPRTDQNEHAVIEAVPGPCSGLVDGSVDPDHWLISRATRQVASYRPGQRDGGLQNEPLLAEPDLESLLSVLDQVERQLGWCPDVEWTGRGEQLTILQARPITSVRQDSSDKRAWYLTLRPDKRRLQQLCHRVAEQLIPELRALGDRLAAEAPEDLTDAELADCLEARQMHLDHWKRIYWDEFIPFAHGVRYLGLYYNDAVHPQDPYEFVDLLRGEDMLASQRNRSLQTLAQQVRKSPELEQTLQQAVRERSAARAAAWEGWASRLSAIAGGPQFLEAFQTLSRQFMDVAFGGRRLIDEPTTLLQNILELASQTASSAADAESHSGPAPRELEQRLLDAVGADRHDEAREVLRLARLSWQLRDDDNLLVARVESQLLRVLHVAGARLKAAGRLNADAEVGTDALAPICAALRERTQTPLVLPAAKPADPHPSLRASGETPRQLVGQPAAHGLASGSVRVIRGPQDLGGFRAGEVLVCDAIQPMMTHLVPLAAAVVERRGGMLIHGAIIARELGIPCVNGVPNVVDLLQDGDRVTVDGYLGIVTLGAPEFGLELGITKSAV